MSIVMFPTRDAKQTEERKETISLKPVKLNTLIEHSNDIQSKCSDFMVREVNDSNMRFCEDMSLRYLPFDESGVRNPSMTQYSFSQLCGKLGIPTQYIVKCFNSGRVDLAMDNVNDWMSDYNKDLFIREYDGKVRGVLSDRFAVCDTPDILSVIDDVLDLDRFKIKGSFMNEERLHLRLIEKTMLPIDGEDLFAGMTIDSSDVGRSRLMVNFFIFKQICTNGLCISKGSGQLFCQKHIGITASDFHDEFLQSMKNYDAVCEEVTNLIIDSKEKVLDVNIKSSDEVIQSVISNIKNMTRLSDDSANKVIQLMLDGTYESNKWGMINAITQVAQDFTLERRIELERIAGNILTA